MPQAPKATRFAPAFGASYGTLVLPDPMSVSDLHGPVIWSASRPADLWISAELVSDTTGIYAPPVKQVARITQAAGSSGRVGYAEIWAGQGGYPLSIKDAVAVELLSYGRGSSKIVVDCTPAPIGDRDHYQGDVLMQWPSVAWQGYLPQGARKIAFVSDQYAQRQIGALLTPVELLIAGRWYDVDGRILSGTVPAYTQFTLRTEF